MQQPRTSECRQVRVRGFIVGTLGSPAELSLIENKDIALHGMAHRGSEKWLVPGLGPQRAASSVLVGNCERGMKGDERALRLDCDRAQVHSTSSPVSNAISSLVQFRLTGLFRDYQVQSRASRGAELKSRRVPCALCCCCDCGVCWLPRPLSSI